MKWKQIPLGPLQTNCYILFNDQKDCLVIDPGSEGDRLVSYLQQGSFNPLAVLLTHAHFDHIGAVNPIRSKWRIPVYLHQEEQEWLGNPALNGSARHPMEPISIDGPDMLFEKESELEIGPFKLSVLHTPGHSPGGVSLYLREEDTVFSGDALFNEGIGRTDLVGGHHDTLIESIHGKLFHLPERTTVLPGHGFATSIEHEKENNPFV